MVNHKAHSIIEWAAVFFIQLKLIDNKLFETLS
jgi:hypothetical protein